MYEKDDMLLSLNNKRDWLRKEKKLHIEIGITISGAWYVEVYDLKEKRNSEIPIEEKLFPSYEDALNHGVEYCLNNLI